jgi:hypothetical protein
MRKVPAILLGATLALSLAHARVASAAEDDAPAADAAAAPAPVAAPPPAAPPPASEEAEMRHAAIIFNPLAVFIGRYSIQGEYLPAMHHALTLNPFYTSVDGGSTNGISLGKFSGFGGELGYKFYTGSKGPNGFFIGPSLLFASYKQTGACLGLTNCANAPSSSFTSLGFALDFGGQGVIGGFVIGGGFGIQSTHNSINIATDSLSFGSAIIAGGGLRPRFLLTVGYAF